MPGSPFPTVPGGGPEGFLGAGKWLYVALKNAGAIAAFRVAADGSLTPLAGSPFPAGRGAYSMAGENGYVYAINNQDGTISAYRQDATSGNLTAIAGSPFPGAVSAGDALYGSGSLFVSSAASNAIYVFGLDATSGNVSPQSGSPFAVPSGLVALTFLQFPVVDPP